MALHPGEAGYEEQSESRSIQRRKAAQQNKPAPTFEAEKPLPKKRYLIEAHFSSLVWKKLELTVEELDLQITAIVKDGWIHQDGNKVIIYPPQSLQKVVVTELALK
jgi:hypothetical protein